MDILNKLREELQVERWQVEAAVKLIDEGNTIPFISRYRKEATGSLNDEVLEKSVRASELSAQSGGEERPPLWRASKSRAS